MARAGGTPNADELRDNMRGSRLGVPFPSHEDEDSGDPPADEDQDDAEEVEPTSAQSRRGGDQLSSTVQSGAGWVLGLLLWAWVGLPLIQGGPKRVGQVLRAKFLNKGPDGKALP